MYSEDDMGDNKIQTMLMKLFHLYFARSFTQLSDTGVHPGQMPMIRLLGENEGLSQKEISLRLHIKPPTVNVSLKRMEISGLIERRPDEEDQRITRICLSEKGREFYEKMCHLVDHNEELIFKGFTESEICLTKRFFEQIIRNLQEEQ